MRAVQLLFACVCLSVAVVHCQTSLPCKEGANATDCTLEGAIVVFPNVSSSFSYRSLTLSSASNISCANQDAPDGLCFFTFNVSKLVIQGESVIAASVVSVFADELTILDGGIDVSGRGPLLGKGAGNRTTQVGASFGGFGAKQSNTDKIYGELDLPDDPSYVSLLGSGMGYPLTEGGGAIRIKCDYLFHDGYLLAVGRYRPNWPGMGSGGSISIRPYRYKTFQSVGGSGLVNAGSYEETDVECPGSGGGRIYIETDTSQFQIIAYGGWTGIDPWTAAPGTVLLYNASTTVRTLIVDSGKFDGTTLKTTKIGTPLRLPSAGNGQLTHLFILGFSTVMVQSTTTINVTGTLRIADFATVQVPSASFLHILAKSVDLLNSGSLLDPRQLSVTSEFVNIDNGASIKADETMTLNVTKKIRVRGTIEGSLNSCVALYAPDIDLQSNNLQMSGGKLFLWATSSFSLKDRRIKAQRRYCIDDPMVSLNGSCQGLVRSANLLNALRNSNYSVIIHAPTISITAPAVVIGSRILICGHNASVTGAVDASAMGCLHDEGIAPGGVVAGCGPSGGSHGGRGSSGSYLVSPKNCTFTRAVTYDDPWMPSMEGSGGSCTGSEDISTGGGVVHFDIHTSLSVHGSVMADADKTEVHLPQPLTPSGHAEAINVGARLICAGGAGGSIFVRTGSLDDNGFFRARGAYSTDLKAGSGGGGRVSFQFRDEQTGMRGWAGTVDAEPAGSAEPGSVLSNSRCLPGFVGTFCTPCPVGAYMNVSGGQTCFNCTNAPERGIYTTSGVNSSSCPYRCAAGMDPVESNPMCLSDLDRFLTIFGGWGGLLGIFFGVLFAGIIFLLWRKHSEHRSQMLRRVKRNRQVKRVVQFEGSSRSLLVGSQPLVAQDIKPEFGSEDLPYHLHRIYLLGDNCYFRPWGLPQHPPRAIADLFIAESYGRFVEGCNELSSWQLWEHVVWVVLTFLYFPLAYAWLWYRRQLRADWLRQYVSTCDQGFWRSLRARNLSNSLKFTSSPDHTLAYLDIMDYDRSLMDWTAKPVLPLVACLEGDGSYFWPFQLPSGDPLVESISLYTGKPIFDAFFDGFNAVARTVCGPYNGSGPAGTVYTLTKYIKQINAESMSGRGLTLSLCVMRACCPSVRGKVNGDLSHADADSPNHAVDSSVMMTGDKPELMCALDDATVRLNGFWRQFKIALIVRDSNDILRVLPTCHSDNVYADTEIVDGTMLTTTACATSPISWIIGQPYSRQGSQETEKTVSDRSFSLELPKASIGYQERFEDLWLLADSAYHPYQRIDLPEHESTFTSRNPSVISHESIQPHVAPSRPTRTRFIVDPVVAAQLASSFIYRLSVIAADLSRWSHLILRNVYPRFPKLILAFLLLLISTTQGLLLYFILDDYHNGDKMDKSIYYLVIFFYPMALFIALALSLPWVLLQRPRLGRVFQSFNVLSIVNCFSPIIAEMVNFDSVRIGRGIVFLLLQLLSVLVSSHLQAAVETSLCLRKKPEELDDDRRSFIFNMPCDEITNFTLSPGHHGTSSILLTDR